MARAFPWLKIIFTIALVAVLGAGAALVALKSFFPEPKIRAMIVDAARKQLGREVRLSGLGVGLTGLKLRGLEISERPDFTAGTFLSVESFSLRPSWNALLRKRLVVASATADGLKVSVVKAADGSFNYETLAATAAPSAIPASKSPEAPAPEFNVRHLRIKRGAVEYRDDAAKTSWAVSGLALALDNFSLSDPFDLDISFRVRGKAGARPIDAAFAFAGVIHPERGDRKKFKAEIRRVSVEQDGVKLAAKGRVSGLEAPDAEFGAEISIAAKTLLEASGKVNVSSAAVRVIDADLKVKTPGFDTTLLSKLLPGAAIPALILPSVDGVLAGRWEGDSASLRTLRLAWSGGRLEASGAARGLAGKTPAYEGRANFGLDVPEIKPGQYSFLKLPPKVFVPAMRLDGGVSYAADDLTVTAFTAKLKQGSVSATGVVRKLSSAKPVPELALSFALDLPDFKASDLPFPVSGLSANFAVPAVRLDGGARARGDDVMLDKVIIKGKGGTLRLDGTVAKALAGSPEPALEIQADLDLPALTDKDIPFAGVPVGLELPASRWEADLSYAPRAVRLRKLGVKIASNEISVSGGVSDPAGRAAFDLIFKCKRFELSELTRLTPQTRELKLAGGGFFALSVTGSKEKPVFGGKLQFKGLGATVADLALADFTGTASFDERRIDVPNLKGKVADGALTMDLTVKDYAKTPEIQLEATLDRFDLGKYLTAKNKLVQNSQAAKAGKPAAAEKPAAPMRTRGRVEIGMLIHPNATVEKTAVSWDLYGVTPDMRRLSGDAKLNVGGGSLHAVGEMAAQSPVVKILVFPLLIVQKIGGIGGIRLFPDFNNITLRRIVGDYLFKDGVMTLRQSEIDSDAAQVSAKGTINLPAEALDLIMTAQVANVAPIDVAVTGTVTSPKTSVNVAKFLAAPAKQLIEGLLKR